jgi:hypothetical protein
MPAGVVGYVVVVPGRDHALFVDKGAATDYASRWRGFVWPVVCSKRYDDHPPATEGINS